MKLPRFWTSQPLSHKLPLADPPKWESGVVHVECGCGALFEAPAIPSAFDALAEWRKSHRCQEAP